MPLGKGVRYRWVVRGGKKIRLAFDSQGNVIEVKKKGGQAKRVTPTRKEKRRKK